MGYSRALLLLALLLGCGTLPPSRQLPPADATAALAAWASIGLPVGNCREAMQSFRVAVVDDVAELCPRTGYRHPHGCTLFTDTGLLGLGGDYTVLVMRRDLAGPELLAHELTHALAGCSGLNSTHEDKLIFGTPGSAEVAIRSALEP